MPHHCSLSVHDESVSSADVLLNLSIFPTGAFEPGAVVRLIALDDDQTRNAETALGKSGISVISGGQQGQPTGRKALPRDIEDSESFDRKHDGNQDPDTTKGYIFKAQDAGPEMLAKAIDAQIESSAFEASHVELVLREEYLTRADMWHLTTTELANGTVYKGQKIWFMRTIKALVKNVFINGQKVQSALFSASTKPIFRSESARYVVFIQMSKEMWDFEASGSGDIVFHQVTDGLLPELFRRWQQLKAKHIITVVLFTRIEYEGHFDGDKYSDFYRVIVSDMASEEWQSIIALLKSEFKVFLKETSIRRPIASEHYSLARGLGKASTIRPSWVITGKPTIAVTGNILEAINLASSQFAYDYLDCDFLRTGVSIVMVTPGTGLFEVDRKLLINTTKNLTTSGIGIDLVCLSNMPLHSSPVFRYRGTSRNPQDSSVVLREAELRTDSPPSKQHTWETDIAEWSFGIPHWIDVSFWTSAIDYVRQYSEKPKSSLNAVEKPIDTNQSKSFHPRVRMHKLQMMGVMEDIMDDIAIPHLRINCSAKNMQTTSAGLNRPIGSPISASDAGKMASLEWQSTQNNQPTPALDNLVTQQMGTYDNEVFQDLRGKQREDNNYVASATLSTAKSNQQYSMNAQSSNATTALGLDVAAKGSEPHGKRFTKHSPVASSTAPKSTSVFKQDSSTKISKSLRRISFGPRGFGATTAKAVASTELTAEHAKSESRSQRTLLSRDRITPPAPTIAIAKDRPRPTSAYSLDMTKGSYASSHPSDPEDQRASRPIPIRNATALPVTEETADLNKDGRHVSCALGNNQDQSLLERIKQKEKMVVSYSPSDIGTQSCHKVNAEVLAQENSLEPWLTMLNPSNPKVDISFVDRLRRWQYVFPRSLRVSRVKWKSLCSPAVIPINSEDYWSPHNSEEPQEQSYRIELNKDHSQSEHSRSRDWLFKELISMRLSQGFQITTSVQKLDIFRQDMVLNDGSELQLIKGDVVHRLRYVTPDVIDVVCFRRGTTIMNSLHDSSIDYKPFIRTVLGKTYAPQEINIGFKQATCDWREVDAFLAGRPKNQLSELNNSLPCWRARFVLIPVDPPPKSRRPVQPFSEDNDEEIRLEGIRKLTQIWQRYRYVSTDERRFSTLARVRKDTNPLDIRYQTRNPSAIVAAEKESIEDSSATEKPVELLPESELFQRSNLSLEALAQAIQSENGVRMMDRRWHFIIHYSCFIGFEFTTWLFQNFRDVDSREEAVQLGNDLMNSGLFQHVQQRHNFRDGNFFYQIASEYRTPRAETKSWFGSRKSVPATPVSEGADIDVPANASSRSKSNDQDDGKDSTVARPAAKHKVGVALSKSMVYDVDHRKRSYRPELINLHYDRVHNPDNCYHIRIDWMNTTSKLIEDAIISWTSTVERYGLLLVPVPIGEAAAITTDDPFHAPYAIELIRKPPSEQRTPQTYFDAKSFAAPVTSERHLYQKAILRKFDYVLDFEAANEFPADVDVTYSWGKPDYQYAQYIHRSGTLLAQISDDGNFLLLPNRLHNIRSTSSQDERPMGNGDTQSRTAQNYRAATHRESPGASPRESPVLQPASEKPKPGNSRSASAYATPEQLKDELESFCSNGTTLEAFYSEVCNAHSQQGCRTPILEKTIPALCLPPSLPLR